MANIAFLLLTFTLSVLVVLFILMSRTYRKRLNKQNQQLMEDAFETMTNEMLTPLTIIEATIEQMREEHVDNKKWLDMIALNLLRLVRLTQQMKETTQLNRGDMPLRVSNFDVVGYIKDTATCIKPLMIKKGINLQISSKPDTMMGWADADLLDKIIFNLLLNTTKHTGKDGSVMLNVSTNDNYDLLQLRIADTGAAPITNITEQQADNKLANIFHSHDNNRDDMEIALVKQLVNKHGGQFHHTHISGQGSTFTVELPIGMEAFTADQRCNTLPSENSDMRNTTMVLKSLLSNAHALHHNEHMSLYSAKNILMVEDNIELQALMAFVLQPYYNITFASKVDDAIQQIESNDIDIVVTEEQLSQTNVMGLVDKIRQLPEDKRMPIVMLSANAAGKKAKRTPQDGISVFINKPFRMSELLLQVNNLLMKCGPLPDHTEKDSAKLDSIEEIKIEPTTVDNEFMKRVTQLINDNMQNPDYDRDALASDIGASTSTLYNKLRAATGTNVSSFIRDMRIKTACRIAQEEPDLRVSDIAYQVGFKDPKYFATTFKRVMGMQPSEYFERLRAQQR